MAKLKTKRIKQTNPISRNNFLTKKISLSARECYRVIPPSFIEMRKAEIKEKIIDDLYKKKHIKT